MHTPIEETMAALEDLVRAGKVLAQLEDNLKALDLKLSADELGRLDALTKPTFGFPQIMQPWFAAIHNGGTSVNGVLAPPSPFVVEKGDKIY